ncbi:tyrosine recombinase XerC [Solimonas variicoloris]|uniref:tyrosine recombinase XerC n=1 Tax=Solimonas variicoloris TaxID=254408 RepID=UPI0003787CB8|nr:tyrosine recombinase XerC [Solimonas variicoloris]
MKAAAPAAESEAPAFFAPLVDDYLGYLRDEKRYSPHTVAAAERDLRRFGHYCGLARVTALEQIDVHRVRDFLGAQRRAGREPASLHRYLSSLRGWFRFLVRQQRLAANPAAQVRAPKLQRKLPAVIDAETLSATLDRDTAGDEDAVRARALIELFYSTGMRLAELHGLDVGALDARQQELTVTGKGSKQRIVLLGGKARAALDAWLACRAGLAGVGEPALFVSSRGGRLSRTAIARTLRDWARRNGLGVHLHPHRLRHSFATHMLENSGDLRAVQEMLGHAHLSTTQIYTHLDWKHLATVYDDAHPRARRRRDP